MNKSQQTFFEIAAEVGLEPDDKEAIGEGCGEKRPGFDALRQGTSEEFSSELTDERIDNFLNLLEGSEHPDHESLLQLGNLLRKYGRSSDAPKDLNEREVQIVDLGIRYFDKWYEEGLLFDYKSTAPEGKWENSATAAFLINQLAKIKSLSKYELTNFQRGKLEAFLQKGESYLDTFFSKERISGDLQEITSEITRRSEIIDTLLNETSTFEKDKRLARAWAGPHLTRALSAEKLRGSLRKDIMNIFLQVSKNEKIVERMLSEGLNFAEAWKEEEKNDDNLRKLFAEAISLARELPSDSKDKLEEITGIELEQETEAYQRADAALKSKRVKEKKAEFENWQAEAIKRLECLEYLDKHRESIERSVRVSFADMRNSLDRQPAADLYILKNILAAIEMARREVSSDGRRNVDFHYKQLGRDEQNGYIFSFNPKDKEPEPAWYKMHVLRRQIPAARLIAESLLARKENSI